MATTRRGWKFPVFVAMIIALTRIAVFAFLHYRRITRTESIEHLPLLFVLFPEALLHDRVQDPVLFSGLLAAGSAAAVAVVVAGQRALRWKLRR